MREYPLYLNGWVFWQWLYWVTGLDSNWSAQLPGPLFGPTCRASWAVWGHQPWHRALWNLSSPTSPHLLKPRPQPRISWCKVAGRDLRNLSNTHPKWFWSISSSLKTLCSEFVVSPMGNSSELEVIHQGFRASEWLKPYSIWLGEPL